MVCPRTGKLLGWANVTEGPVTPQQRVQLEIKLKPRPAGMGPNSDPLATGLSRVSRVSPGDLGYAQGNLRVRSGSIRRSNPRSIAKKIVKTTSEDTLEEAGGHRTAIGIRADRWVTLDRF